jgi:competence protein ComFC
MARSSFLDFIFPRSCFVCGKAGTDLCEPCGKVLKPAQLRCLHCSRANPYGKYCFRCKKASQADQVLAVFAYKSPLKDVIHQFKYEDASSLGEVFSHLLSQKIKKIPGYRSYKLTFIPLAAHRERQRGYNQARLLVDGIIRELKMERTDLLTRVEVGESQVRSGTKSARRANVRGTFELKTDTKIPSKIILIDDVITTGATVEEAAKVLKKAGVKGIVVLALALA